MAERSRTSLFILLLLVIVAVGSVTVTGGFPLADSSGQTNSTADESEITYLGPLPQDVGQQDYERAGLDVSSAVAGDAQRLQGNFSKFVFEEYESELDGAEWEAFVSETNADISAHILALDGQYERLVREYDDGELSTGTLLRELLRLDIAATEQRELAEHVNQFTAVDTIPENINEDLILFPNPVVNELEDATRDAESGRSVYVQSTDDALVLAMAGPEHLRQATLRGERDKDAPDQFEDEEGIQISLAVERANELYSWTSVRSIGTVSGAPGVYRAEMPHDYTDLTLYLDGGTTNVFHEIQRVQSASVPVSETATNTTAALELTVEKTDPTGPMRVSVTDAATGDPVEATVTVDDNHVGSTDVEGQLWVTQPIGTFDVTVTTPEGETATVAGL